MKFSGGIRRKNAVSGRLLFGHPLRVWAHWWHGGPVKSVQVVLPGVWFSFIYRDHT